MFDVEIKRGESQFYRVQVDGTRFPSFPLSLLSICLSLADELYVFIMFRTAAIDPFLRKEHRLYHSRFLKLGCCRLDKRAR